MADFQPPIELDLEDNGGTIRFADTASARRWLERERKAWDWLNARPPQANPFNVADHVRDQFDTLAQALMHAESDPHGYRVHLLNGLQGAYAPTPPNLWHSSSQTGRTILDIREGCGPHAAAFAYGFSRGAIALSNATNPEHLRGALLVSVPTLMPSSNISAVLGAQRREFALTFDRLNDDLRGQATKRAAELEDYLGRARRIAFKSMALARRRWLTERSNVQADASKAIESIQAVEAAYKGHMQLNASVGYWGEKAAAHGVARADYGNSLRIFAAIAILALGVSFFFAGGFVLETAGYEVTKFIEPPLRQGTGTPTAVYFIVSGFLAIVSTLVFWVGRLLVRLYLSEHHLERDARERVTLVQTYLALIKDKAVEESERSLALQALFRNSSDGIVKDDGMSDAGLQAAITKLLLQNSRTPAA